MNVAPLTIAPELLDIQLSTQAFLRLRLDPQTLLLLPMDSVLEVLTLPVQRISVMPNMPRCVMGLLNRRSRVIWAVDLAQMLGVIPLESHLQQFTAAIVNVQNDRLGLIVRSIEGVQRYNPDLIQSPLGGVVEERWVPYVRGCILEGSEILMVLDPQSIAQSAQLKGL
ncbi:MAG: chemotaxis protein CheW [Cyanobacteria bacterium P01_A01_bin.3]